MKVMDNATGATTVSYSMDSTLAAKLGSIGQPVLRAKAKGMAGNSQAGCAAFGPAADEVTG
jgi:hypothetical protein